MLDLSVIILTKDEKLHIARCLERLLPLFGDGVDDGLPRIASGSRNDGGGKLPKGRVFVVDCLSTDATQEIAWSYGAEVVEHAWPGCQAKQFNWALDNLPIKTKWVLRLDADEYLYPETIEEVKTLLPCHCEESNDEAIHNGSITSLSLSLARAWQGRIIRRGTGKVILKRFFRYGVGRCEERMMDEHIVTSYGRDLLLKGEFVDDNLNNLRWWTEKHLGYAEREACDLLLQEVGIAMVSEAPRNDEVSGQAAVKRRMKGRYARLPLFWRSFAYFCYRYFLHGGFLEGKAGFTWHFFQGWWYRTMVDAKIWEIKRQSGNDPERIQDYIRKLGVRQ